MIPAHQQACDPQDFKSFDLFSSVNPGNSQKKGLMDGWGEDRIPSAGDKRQCSEYSQRKFILDMTIM